MVGLQMEVNESLRSWCPCVKLPSCHCVLYETALCHYLHQGSAVFQSDLLSRAFCRACFLSAAVAHMRQHHLNSVGQIAHELLTMACNNILDGKICFLSFPLQDRTTAI